MLRDIAIAKNNEVEFVEITQRLGIKKLYFLYDFDEYNAEKLQKKLENLNHHSVSIETGFIVNQKNISKAAQHSKLLVAKSSDKDRFFIESKKVKLIYGFEETGKKDYLHQRASGLNHILCELASKNNVAVGFSYSRLFKDAPSAALIGRIMQNIGLCRKYKVKTVIGSFSEKPYELRAPHDIMSLFAMLGMNAKNAKESLFHSL